MGFEKANINLEEIRISEKKILAIVCAVKKFDFELKGRKSNLVTDHTLEIIPSKPEYLKNRIKRWINMIKEYDFTIEYQKAKELETADSLSLIFMEEIKNKKKRKYLIKNHLIKTRIAIIGDSVPGL